MRLSNKINMFLGFKYQTLFALCFVITMTLFQFSKVPDLNNLSILDFVSALDGQIGSSNLSVLVFGIIPIVTATTLNTIERDERHYKILKYTSRIQLWNKNVIVILSFSVILSIMVVFGGYLFGGVFLHNFHNKWVTEQGSFYNMLNEYEKGDFSFYSKNINTIKVLLILLITKFLGVAVISMFTVLLKTLIKNNLIVFSLIIILGYLDGYYFNISIMVQKMVININGWKNIRFIFVDQFYLFALIIALYFFCRELYNKKDFFA